MFCSRCGRENDDNNYRCVGCGSLLHPPPPPSFQLQPPLEADPVTRMLIPVGRSLWAVAAGYLGLLSIVVFPAPLAIIVSAVALWDLKRNPKLFGKGRAIFGMVMGILGTVVLICILLLWASGPPRGTWR